MDPSRRTVLAPDYPIGRSVRPLRDQQVFVIRTAVRVVVEVVLGDRLSVGVVQDRAQSAGPLG